MDILIDKMSEGQEKPDWDLLVIGDGLAARNFLHYFCQEKVDNKKILQIAANNSFASCSLATTAVVSLDGIRQDVSPLGNSLLDAYNFFEDEYFGEFNQHIDVGVIRVDSNNNDEQILRRYQGLKRIDSYFELKAFVVNSYDLLEKLKSSYYRDITFKNEIVHLVTEINDGVYVETNKGRYFAKKVILAIGWGAKFISPKNDTKTVAGHFLAINFDLSNIDSAIVYQWKRDKDNIRFYVRKNENKLMIGSFNQKNEIQSPDLYELQKIYQFVSQRSFPLQLPPFKNWQKHVGIRAKGPKMRPFWGIKPGHEHLNEIKNLYKNGLSLAPLAGKQLASSIKEQLS